MASLGALAGGAEALGQCEVLVRESFRLGERPHGGNGRPRDINIHDSLKDCWPQTPDQAMWISTDQTGVPTWAFAASSLDPAEADPLDPFNGTAFGEAPAAAVLPFSTPATAFTVSAEAVMLQFSSSATYLGLTSQPVLLSNFETHGALWMSLDGDGRWAIYANGFNVVASGQAPLVGTLDSGWLHMEFTYDPGASTVSGRVMGTVIPPTPVTLTTPIAYFGMEAHVGWNVLNNLSIYTGTPLGVSVSGGGPVCNGGTATFTAATNGAAPAVVQWRRDNGFEGVLLGDGPRPDGSVVSGATTGTLAISNVSGTSAGSYFCVVSNACGLVAGDAAALTICGADYNCDGFVDGIDYDQFNNDFESGAPGADYNRDGFVDGIDYDGFNNDFAVGC